jgi:hypothetical protein
MQREFVNLNDVYNVVKEILDEQKASEVINKLLPMSTRMKSTRPKNIETLVNVLQGINFKQKHNLKQSEDEIAKIIEKKGLADALV